MRTPEEIKQLAIKCGFSAGFIHTKDEGELQTFYQRAVEEGRKIQRDSDAVVAARVKFANPSILTPAEAHMWDMATIAAYTAIRDNKGD